MTSLKRNDPPFRADHVGSLIRPSELVEARKAHLEGRLAAEVLRELEDRAIADAIAMQERVGLQPVTDGELRRNNWRDRFFENVDGFGTERVPSSFIFTETDGSQYRGMPVPTIVGKMRRREKLTTDDFAFLKARTRNVAKATLPSPSVNHFMAGDRSFRGSPYADRREFLADVAAIYRQEIADLGAAGCTYLQIDDTSLAIICDPRNQHFVRERGEEPLELIDDYVAAINDAIRDRPEGLTICVHTCRGNAGKGVGSGGYDPVAQKIFNNLDVDGYFLEYDDERSGSFDPLREVPDGKFVVLGLMSTKLGEIEPIDDLRRRVDEAARHIPLAQLCLSPQCGFASIFDHTRFTLDQQERKLAHLVEAASRIWN